MTRRGHRESIHAYELAFLLIGCKTFPNLRLAQKGKNLTQRRSSEERMREWNRVPRSHIIVLYAETNILPFFNAARGISF